MKTVGTYEAKTHLPQLLARVKKGEKILITRRGVPVALLTPPPAEEKPDVAKVVVEMLTYRDQQKCSPGPNLHIKHLIEEGRR